MFLPLLPIPLSLFSGPLANVLCSLFHVSVPCLTSSVPCLPSPVPCLLSSVPCLTWSVPFHPSSVTCLSSMFIVTCTLFLVSLLCSLFHILCSLSHNFSLPCLPSSVICLTWSVHCLPSSFPNLRSLFSLPPVLCPLSVSVSCLPSSFLWLVSFLSVLCRSGYAILHGNFPLPIKKVKFSSVGARSANACVMREWGVQRQCMRISWFPLCSACDETVSAYAQHGMKSFHVCSACGEIISVYAQRAMKSFPRLPSMRSDVHVKTVKISSHTEHTQKFVRRMLSTRWNPFLVCTACHEIVSVYARHKQTIIFENDSKISN